MSLPPFGILGWASPLTAAGILFPEWGWLGLAMTLVGLLTLTSRFWPYALSVFTLAFVIAGLTWTPPEPPKGWTGINTAFGDGTSYSLYQQQLETLHRVHEAQEQGASFILLPENSFDVWTSATGNLWQRELAGSDVTVIGGTSVLQTDETYDNGLLQVSATGSSLLYRQRMPVPISMWRPWARGGASANMFDNPAFTLAGQTMATLICYEQLLIWPVLHSMLLKPDILLAPGNAWWSNNSNIAHIQTAATQGWAKLFGMKLVSAVNK